MQNINELRTLVKNGWTIANRKALKNIVGQEEMSNLGQLFKTKGMSHTNLTSFAGAQHTMSTDRFILNRTSPQSLNCTTSVNFSNIYYPRNQLSFKNSEINAASIEERIKSFEKKVVDYFNTKKELPDTVLDSKTVKKLYSPEFKAARKVNEDGYNVTTIIDKSTGKPTEAYVKLDNVEIEEGSNRILEHWNMYVKNNKGEYQRVGKRTLEINEKNKQIFPEWMDAKEGYEKYEGIGLRLHQIGVERMMQNKFDTVRIYSSSDAFPFHYKSGFRGIQKTEEVDTAFIDNLLKRYNKYTKIDKNELQNVLVSQSENGKIILDGQSYENLFKLIYEKNSGKLMPAYLPMDLHGEALTKWKQLAASQPILNIA